MWRHIAQVVIALLICAVYSIVFFAEETKVTHYFLISNLVGFFLLLSFLVEIKSRKFLRKEYFKPFAIDHLSLMLKRISTYYKRCFLWMLLIMPPLMLLFVSHIPAGLRATITLLAMTQNIFTVYLFFSLYDLLEIKGYERHINLLPAIVNTLLVFARYGNQEEFYYLNPFGGIINLPLLANPWFYLVPIGLFAALYFFNKYYTSKYWIKE